MQSTGASSPPAKSVKKRKTAPARGYSGPLKEGKTPKTDEMLDGPTISSGIKLRDRKGKRPVIDSESELSTTYTKDDASEPKEASKKPRLFKRAAGPIEHLHQGSTVIVGAGVIGLFIARELAMKARATRTDHPITVIDAKSDVCRLASYHCAGFLAHHDLPESMHELAGVAYSEWVALLSDDHVRDAVGFTDDSLFRAVNAKDHDGSIDVPYWYTEEQGLQTEPTWLGRLYV